MVSCYATDAEGKPGGKEKEEKKREKENKKTK